MDSDSEDIILATYMLLLTSGLWILNRKRRQRKYAVRPMNRRRQVVGHYQTLLKYMEDHDHSQFFKYTRMTPALYRHLLELIKPQLQKTPYRNPLSPGHRLAMTLHYLSEGCSMQQIAWDYFVGKTTAHKVIKETCGVLWSALMPLYLQQPDEEGYKTIAQGFENRWNLPNCIGALDGKHIQIQAPNHSGTTFFNYKKSFSIVLMATCDHEYKFTTVDIGAEGSSHDSSVFKNSLFGKALLDDRVDLPPDKPLPGSDMPFPHFLVADQAFPLNRRIMRPYPGENLLERHKVYNYRLSRARRCIENAFGILAQRWRILRKPIIGGLDTCQEIVQATVVLHNYIQKSEMDLPASERQYCPTGFRQGEGSLHYESFMQDNFNLQSIGRVGSNNATRFVQHLRDHLSHYLISDAGSVPWQMDHVYNGVIPPGFR